MRWFCLLVLLAACGAPPRDPPEHAASTSDDPEEETPSLQDAPEASTAGLPSIDAPRGWRFERRKDAFVVVSPKTPAVMALSTLPLEATREDMESEARALTLEANLAVEGGVRLAPLANQKHEFGARRLALWEIHGAERKGATGAMIVFAGKLTDDALVIGIGFAPTEDHRGTESILDALASITPPR